MFNYYEIEISGKYVKNLFSDIIKNKINIILFVGGKKLIILGSIFIEK